MAEEHTLCSLGLEKFSVVVPPICPLSPLINVPLSPLFVELQVALLIKNSHFIFEPVITDLILPNNCFMAMTCIFTRTLVPS